MRPRKERSIFSAPTKSRGLRLFCVLAAVDLSSNLICFLKRAHVGEWSSIGIRLSVFGPQWTGLRAVAATFGFGEGLYSGPITAQPIIGSSLSRRPVIASSEKKAMAEPSPRKCSEKSQGVTSTTERPAKRSSSLREPTTVVVFGIGSSN